MNGIACVSKLCWALLMVNHMAQRREMTFPRPQKGVIKTQEHLTAAAAAAMLRASAHSACLAWALHLWIRKIKIYKASKPLSASLNRTQTLAPSRISCQLGSPAFVWDISQCVKCLQMIEVLDSDRHLLTKCIVLTNTSCLVLGDALPQLKLIYGRRYCPPLPLSVLPFQTRFLMSRHQWHR